MDFETARQFLLGQTLAGDRSDSFMACLGQGRPPVPGQVTSLLLALKVLFAGLRGEAYLDRSLVQALVTLIHNAPELLRQGQAQGVLWPPLLEADLQRLSQGAQAIIQDHWPE